MCVCVCVCCCGLLLWFLLSSAIAQLPLVSPQLNVPSICDYCFSPLGFPAVTQAYKEGLVYILVKVHSEVHVVVC